MAKYIRERTNTKIVAGGGNGCSELWQAGLMQGVLDYVVQGPGEVSLVRLIDSLRSNIDTHNISALCYQQDSRVRMDCHAEQVLPE